MLRPSRLAALALGLLVASVPLADAAGQEGDRRLTSDLFLELEDPGPHLLAGGTGPRISPDGSQVIYARRRVDRVNDRWRSELWILDADGDRNRFLADGGGAVWSPDGSRIAYVAEGDQGRPQIFVRWMDDEGTASQITRLEHAPGALAWSPDGERLAFVSTVPDDGSELTIDLPERPEGAEWTPAAKVVTRADYRQDYVGYTDQGYRHVFVVRADGGTPRQLTDGDWDHGAPEWTPDGREILFTALREPGADTAFRESEIYAVDVDTREIRQLTDREGPDRSPVVGPEGRRVAYKGFDATDDTYVAPSIYVMDIDGSNPRRVSGDFDRRSHRLFWGPDGEELYFTAPSEGRSNLRALDLEDREVRRVTEGDHLFTAYSTSRDGVVAGVRYTPRDPGNVFTVDAPAGSGLRQLTDVNADVLDDVELGEVEEFWYPSTDGLRIQGWIVKPPGFDPSREYPLMLSIHGGPHSMYGFGTPYMWFGWQNNAANGYVVLYTNPRGSSGYGSEFGNAIENDYPGEDYDDLMTGVDSLLARGYIDEDRLFVYGCSGGGVLTSWIIGHTDRFDAASVECPVTDWLSFVGTTDGLGWYRNFEHLPWEDPSEHLRRSPLMYVGNVTTPTILISGVEDLRTPIGQTEEYYQALQLLGVPSAMVRLQDEWHAYFNRPSNTLRTILYRRAWFEKHDGEP
jgi:dipeptidyl aminopeptidase/acylaminoacyl peptidase